MHLQTLYIGVVILLFATGVMTQEDTLQLERYDHKIDTNSYNKAYNEVGWEDTKRVLKLKKSNVDKTKTPKKRKSNKILKIGGMGFQLLGYLAVLLLIVWILYLLLVRIKINPSVDVSTFVKQEVESLEDLDTINAQEGLAEALANGDYAQALAMHYILVLQQLSQGQGITWEPSKTNRDYVKEMLTHRYYSEFKKVSGAFDLVNYGDRPFGSTEYNELLPSLNLFTHLQLDETNE